MFYRLDGHTPVKCADGHEWAEWYEKAGDSRIVARDETGRFLVSTIFCGIDISHEAAPVLFETMVFESGKSIDTARFATWEQAEAGHRRMVRRVRNSSKFKGRAS